MKKSIFDFHRRSLAVCGLLMVLMFNSCKPSVDTDVWENRIRPEMESHKAYLIIYEQLEGYCFTEMDINLIDPDPESHIIDALDYVESYIADSLDSYSDIRYFYDVLSQKDEAGELDIEYSAEEQVAGSVQWELIWVIGQKNTHCKSLDIFKMNLKTFLLSWILLSM